MRVSDELPTAFQIVITSSAETASVAKHECMKKITQRIDNMEAGKIEREGKKGTVQF